MKTISIAFACLVALFAAGNSAQAETFVTSNDLRTLDGSSVRGGTAISILESRGNAVRLGVDSDEAGQASEVWVSATDLMHSGIERVEEGDLEEESLAEDAARRRGKRKMTYCYRYVKLYLLERKKVRVYLPGVSAWMAAGELPKHGFRKIAGGPDSAKLNDVCVYRGGNGGNGHVEVRVRGGWYYGYGVKPKPISRRNRPFIGCFRK